MISSFNVIIYLVVILATSRSYMWIIMANWTVIFGAGFAIVATFDVYWFLRLAYTRFLSFFRQPISITDVSSWVALNELQKVFPWQFSYTFFKYYTEDVTNWQPHDIEYPHSFDDKPGPFVWSHQSALCTYAHLSIYFFCYRTRSSIQYVPQLTLTSFATWIMGSTLENLILQGK